MDHKEESIQWQHHSLDFKNNVGLETNFSPQIFTTILALMT